LRHPERQRRVKKFHVCLKKHVFQTSFETVRMNRDFYCSFRRVAAGRAPCNNVRYIRDIGYAGGGYVLWTERERASARAAQRAVPDPAG